MSPASQGALEVERYIGSCLISSNVRAGSHKILANRKQQEPTVRGKVPRSCYTTLQPNYPPNNNEQCQMPYNWNNPPMLPISPNSRRCCINQRSSPPPGTQAPRQHCCEQPQHLHKSPLSRLAIHTQGAPLILSGRFHNRQVKLQNNNNSSNNNNNNNSNNNYCSNNSFPSYPHGNRIESNNNNNPNNNNNVTRCPSALQRSQKPPLSETSKKSQQPSNNAKSNADCSVNKDNSTGANTANIDSLSIASDESSGSNNSENSLPRIIKPRKRRKKDRKPPNSNNVSQSDVPKLEEQQQQQSQQQQHQQQQQQQTQQLNSQTTVVSSAEQSYTPLYENNTSHPATRNNRRPPPVGRENLYHGNRIQSSNSGPTHRSFQGKVLDDNRNIVPLSNPGCNNNMQPKGFRGTYHNHHYRHHYHHHHHHHHHHRHNNDGGVNTTARYGIQQQQSHDFNDASVAVGGCEESYRDGLNVCQCRYCDPSGLIWDVDQNCYSLYLTGPTPASQAPSTSPPHFPAPIPPLFMSRVTPVTDCLEQNPVERLFDTENSPATNCTILRRSWSDPTSYFSDDTSVIADTPMKSGNKDIGVIGDRGQAESNGINKRRTLWRGDTLGIFTNGSSRGDCSVNTNEVVGGVTSSLQGLEVSTEIITSPNGHRDLEIKFYSPSPNVSSSSAISADEKSTFEDEDLNDIWSYHESKLQQDFRTLLQAEG